ncbi:LysR substrate-binding domain-containing protein [Catenulispora yoronensis]
MQSGRLEVGGTTTVGTYLLPRLLARFRERHRAIECDIVVGNNGQIVKRLLDGELGLAIVAGQPGAPQLKTENVLDERLLLVAAPGHRLARGPARAAWVVRAARAARVAWLARVVRWARPTPEVKRPRSPPVRRAAR